MAIKSFAGMDVIFARKSLELAGYVPRTFDDAFFSPSPAQWNSHDECCGISRCRITAVWAKSCLTRLVMLDGTKVRRRRRLEVQKAARRNLRQLFQHYMYGYLPPKPQKTVVEQVLFHDEGFLGGKATISETRLAFFGPDLTQRLHVLLVVPNNRSSQVPVFVGMNFCGNHALANHPKIHIPEGWVYKSCVGSENERATEKGRGTQAENWNLDLIVERGYGLACFYSGDIDPDTPDFSDGIAPSFYAQGQTARKPDDAGAISEWAWGYHRVVDFVLSHHSKTNDASRIAAVGRFEGS